MYKNLNASSLGISGRQSELIELTLTYGYRGMDLDVIDFAKRCRSQGLDTARRYLDSAKIKIGSFELPVDLGADDAAFASSQEQIEHIAHVASSVGGKACTLTILPASEELPYHENFERHRQRLATIADMLAQHQIKLGLGFLAAAHHREGKQFQFIHQAEDILTLIKTIGSKNIGLLLDTWNWHLGGGGMDQLSELNNSQIVVVRLADVPADATRETVAEDQRLLPGESGEPNTAAVLTFLANAGYTGPVSVFPHPSRFSGMTRDAIVLRASTVLDEQWRAAGLTRSGKLAPATAEA